MTPILMIAGFLALWLALVVVFLAAAQLWRWRRR